MASYQLHYARKTLRSPYQRYMPGLKYNLYLHFGKYALRWVCLYAVLYDIPLKHGGDNRVIPGVSYSAAELHTPIQHNLVIQQQQVFSESKF